MGAKKEIITKSQQNEIIGVLGKSEEIFTDIPGKTSIIKHSGAAKNFQRGEGQAFRVEFAFKNKGFKFSIKRHLQNHS